MEAVISAREWQAETKRAYDQKCYETDFFQSLIERQEETIRDLNTLQPIVSVSHHSVMIGFTAACTVLPAAFHIPQTSTAPAGESRAGNRDTRTFLCLSFPAVSPSPRAARDSVSPKWTILPD